MEESMNFIKLNNRVFRNTQIYLDRVLKKYELSSGTYYYLFILENHEGISQNKISNILDNDKAMSARTITKLIELGYVYKKEDESDGRAYNLFLTPKAKQMVPEIHKEIEKLISLITVDLSEEERYITKKSLEKVLKVAQKLNEHGGI